MTVEKVAVLGLGTMGAGMAHNLLEKLAEVRVWNRTPARCAPLVEAGAVAAADPSAAVSGVDAVVVCVSDDPALRALVFESGLLDAISPGTLFLDSGTTSVDLTLELGAALKDRGASFIDAPVTGSKAGAEGGTLTFMVGGAADDVARAQPLFEAMGNKVVHAGSRIGDGQRIKVCLNLSQAIMTQGISEGYALAEAQGLEMDKLREVFEDSAANCGIVKGKTPAIANRDFAPAFRLDLMRKDIGLALDRGYAHGQPLPAGHAVAALYDLAMQRGWGGDDFVSLCRLIGLAAD